MRAIALVLGGAACATTTTVCPVGTKRVDMQHADGAAQWCSTTGQRLTAMPVPGRNDSSALGSEPQPMPGGIEGPYTSWYANGNVESHGDYVDLGDRSLPDGVWAFWYRVGLRKLIGRFDRGQPKGCFATWDEAGKRRTGVVEGNTLHLADCTPPRDEDVGAYDARAPVEVRSAFADLSLQGFFGPVGMGARNMLQSDTDPTLRVAISGSARARFGRFRVGPLGGVRLSGSSDYRALSFGGGFGVALPSFHHRIDTEASIEFGAQQITAIASRPMQPGNAHLTFWAPLGALQLSGAFALTTSLQVVVALRGEGAPTRDVDRQVTYCSFLGCFVPEQETWTIGGFAYGLNVGLRLVLR